MFINIKDILHFDCSALNGENVEEAFYVLCKSILKKIQDGVLNLDDNPLNNIVTPFVEEEKIEVSKNYCSNC